MVSLKIVQAAEQVYRMLFALCELVTALMGDSIQEGYKDQFGGSKAEQKGKVAAVKMLHQVNNNMARRDLLPIATYVSRSCESEGSKEIQMHYCKKTWIDTDTPELVAFFQEHNFQFVKDIFMDKEVPSLKNKWLEGKIELDYKNISCILNSDVDNDRESTNRTMETMSSMSDESKLRIENESGKDIMTEDEDGSDTRGIKANGHSDDKIIPQNKLIAMVGSSEACLENFALVSATEEPDENSPTTSDAPSENAVEHGSIIHHHSHSFITSANSDEEFQQKPESKHQHETANTSQPHDDQGQSDSFSISSVSCPTTFLGQGPYSGSTSLRSNSSTASSHSFAFPILASEWNGSPVRMVKADRRQLRKQKNWRMCFPCCKF